ncbi:MAG: hypothetical protein ABIO70_24375 [Pseudomonadota bacterium]
MKSSLLLFALTACVDESEVCTTADGLSCDEAVGRVAELEATVSALEQRLAALEAQPCLTEGDLEGLAQQQDLDDLQDQVDAIADDYVPASDMADAVRLITTDQDETFDNAEDFLAYLDLLDGRRIARDATVTLHLEGGNYAFTEPLTFAHPDGERIEITGAGPTTVLVFDQSEGVVVTGAAALGYLGDLVLRGAGQAGDGLRVERGSAITVGNLTVEDFASVCVRATRNGTIYLSEGTSLDASGCSVGVLAYGSSFAQVDGASAHDNGAQGFAADSGSVLEAPNATATDNGEEGYFANMGSVVDAGSSSAARNGDAAYYVSGASMLSAGGATATSDGASGGFYAYYGSYLAASSAVAENVSNGVVAVAGSTVHAEGANVVSASSTAYRQYSNSYIYASGATGETDTASSWNDFTDGIYGIP